MSWRNAVRGVRHCGERGAFLTLWALLLLSLFAFVALAVDLSNVESQKRGFQSIADLAAIAAGPTLSNNDSVGACLVAWQYVRANTADLPAGASIPCSSLPLATSCVNGTFPGNVGGT